MSDMDFICPTCKRPTRPTDNEIIEYLVIEKDRYRDFLGKRTTELYHTRKVLRDTIKLAEETLESIEDEGMCSEYYENRLNEIKTALEQKDVK